ncbi:MAG: efflux RND transporter periplasmic adaptor subunit, partial [Cyanobacteria bacterium J06598_3]
MPLGATGEPVIGCEDEGYSSLPTAPSTSIIPNLATTLPGELATRPANACITADVTEVTNDNIGPNTLPKPWWKKSGKALIGVGVFTVLSGGILAGAHMFGGMAGHDMGGHGGGHGGGHDMGSHDMGSHDMGGMAGHEGHDMHGMSHDDMMRVDGALNATPVTIEVAKPAPLEASVNYTGSIHPYSEVTVYPRVAGQLSNYEIYPGDRVTAGQILASLEALERTSQTNEAQSTAAALSATVEGSQLELEEQQQAIALIQADLDYLKLQRDRFSSLTQAGAIAQDQYDLVTSQVSAKEALLEGANAKRDRLQAKITSDQAQANRAQAQVNTATTLESYTQITSPISGVVQARMADPGVVVQPGMGIFKIGDYQQVRLRANVAQQDANRIQLGTPITATVPGAETGVIRGTITTIFPQTDMTTRTMTVEAVVDNPDGQLLSGQFVDMQILTEQKAGAIALPQTALVDFKGEPSVWVVSQGNGEEMAQRRRVSVGLMSGDRIEITSGLNAGDRVITSGHSRLMENSTVTVVDDLSNPSESPSESLVDIVPTR